MSSDKITHRRYFGEMYSFFAMCYICIRKTIAQTCAIKKYYIFIMIVVAIFNSGCAQHLTDVNSDPYGFFWGIWHGVIAPFTFIASLFLDDVYVIGRPNTGILYYVGFVIGLFGDSSVAR